MIGLFVAIWLLGIIPAIVANVPLGWCLVWPFRVAYNVMRLVWYGFVVLVGGSR